MGLQGVLQVIAVVDTIAALAVLSLLSSEAGQLIGPWFAEPVLIPPKR